ncbi:hypothetical protein LY76DRAFT_488757, partial [Colletotrichum caudatum]
LNPLQPRMRDRTNENLQKARENIVWRCDETSRRYPADVYILLRQRHKHYEYSSIDASSWPLSKTYIMSATALRSFPSLNPRRKGFSQRLYKARHPVLLVA